MPIPPFDVIENVLPPHLGDPRIFNDLSPYPSSMTEFCNRFATSPERNRILRGLINFRLELHALNIKGFQWLAGSFVEDIESHELRPPGDVDVITFIVDPPAPGAYDAKIKGTKIDKNREDLKLAYSVDHFTLPLGSNPYAVVYITRYWYGLFTHRRDSLWKGIVSVELDNKADDDAALVLLGSTP